MVTVRVWDRVRGIRFSGARVGWVTVVVMVMVNDVIFHPSSAWG